MAEKIVVDIEFKTNVQKIQKDLDSVKDSLKDTNEELSEIKQSAQGTESALKKIGNGFKGIGLALKSAGLFLAIEGFKLLKDVVMQNQTIVDGLSVATETLSVLFNQVTSVVTDVVKAVSKSTEGFDALGKVLGGVLNIAITPMKMSFFAIKLAIQETQLAWENSWLGGKGEDQERIAELRESIDQTKQSIIDVKDQAIESGKAIVTNFGEAVTEVATGVTIATETAVEGVKDISVASATATGQALADAKKNEELLEIQRQRQQLQSQLDAEIQRQIRDDISKTFEERIQANEELGRILDQQLKDEKAIADEKVRIAKLELDTNADNIDLQVKYQTALKEQVDIEERIAGQRSEQLTNTNALIKEQADAITELALIGKTERELEIEELDQWYKQKSDLAIKSGQDLTSITEEYNKKINAIDLKYKMEQLDNLSNTIQMANGLFAEGTAMSKITGVATATIDTYKAVNMALASAPPPLSFIQAGLTLATGLKNVKEILSVKTEKPVSANAPSGGGISAPSTGSTEQLTDLSGVPSMVEQFNTAFTQERPVRAYVVEQDVTNSQQINTMIEQKATL
jgi:hypothetical protein